MAVICPTITAKDLSDYKHQLRVVEKFAPRVHIDLGDGIFTPEPLVEINDLYLPDKFQADFHVMYQDPFIHIEKIIELRPNLIIVHAEANGDFSAFCKVVG